MHSHSSHPAVATESAPLISPFDDPECRYVALPTEMQTFSIPAVAGELAMGNAAELLSRLAADLDSLPQGKLPEPLDLAGWDTTTRRYAEQVLGEGEIAILADGPNRRLSIRETVFAGVWRVAIHGNGGPEQEYLEVGPAPRALPAWARELTGGTEAVPKAYPPGLMNAPALLNEIHVKAAAFKAGGEEVFNLTLLPMTPDDLQYLATSLGLAGLSVLSKGYGDCRVSLTRLPNVWWVQYFNSTDQLILNTLEITAIPQVVLAAPEDFEDSAQRLRETVAGLV